MSLFKIVPEKLSSLYCFLLNRGISEENPSSFEHELAFHDEMDEGFMQIDTEELMGQVRLLLK